MAGIPPGTPPRPLRDPSREAQNIDFSKILGMASPGVEYVPTSLETIFKLSRGPQRPYIEKSENFENLKNSKNPEIRPPYSPGLGPSYLARYAAPLTPVAQLGRRQPLSLPGSLTCCIDCGFLASRLHPTIILRNLWIRN